MANLRERLKAYLHEKKEYLVDSEEGICILFSSLHLYELYNVHYLVADYEELVDRYETEDVLWAEQEWKSCMNGQTVPSALELRKHTPHALRCARKDCGLSCRLVKAILLGNTPSFCARRFAETPEAICRVPDISEDDRYAIIQWRLATLSPYDRRKAFFGKYDLKRCSSPEGRAKCSSPEGRDKCSSPEGRDKCSSPERRPERSPKRPASSPLRRTPTRGSPSKLGQVSVAPPPIYLILPPEPTESGWLHVDRARFHELKERMEVHGALRELLAVGDITAQRVSVLSKLSRQHLPLALEVSMPGESSECGICKYASVQTRSHAPIVCCHCDKSVPELKPYRKRPDESSSYQPPKRELDKGGNFVCENCVEKRHQKSWELKVNCADLCPDRIDCASCFRTFHKVCALVPLKGAATRFTCPDCLLLQPPPAVPTPLCRLLKTSAVAVMVEEELVAYPDICVREVFRAHTTMDIDIIPLVRFRKNERPVLPCTQRILCFFCDGIVVFVMTVYEFDQRDAGVNTNRVYIDYLDSAGSYCVPRFGDLVQAYLKTAHKRGFKAGHLWVNSPGTKWFFLNDPHISRAVLSDQELNDWYMKQFRQLQKEGVVATIDDFWGQFPNRKLPEFYDGFPLFSDSFSIFLSKKPTVDRLEDHKLNIMPVLHFAPPSQVQTIPPEQDLSSVIFSSRESFIEWQRDQGLRMSDYRFAAHTSYMLVKTLLDEQGVV